MHHQSMRLRALLLQAEEEAMALTNRAEVQTLEAEMEALAVKKQDAEGRIR